MANPARAYLATQVETTTQGELLIMLYEAAIKFLKRAKIEIDNKDYAKKGIYISKAMAIIHELSECLNKEKGGDITPKLSQLYLFCTTQLVKANIRLNNKMIDDVINILDGLRSAYAQIVPVYEGTGASGATVQTTDPAQPQSAPGTQSVPQSSSPPPAPQQHMAYARPTSMNLPPMTPPVAQAKAETSEPNAKKTEPQTKPVAQESAPPLTLRPAAHSAKFRAANAYTNSSN
jgi:flagellar protein FliS